MQHRSVILLVITVLLVALIYTPAITFSVENQANHFATRCKPTGKQGPPPHGLALVKCCWEVRDEGGLGGFVTYCSTCEDGGTRGKINCTEPTKQSFTLPDRLPPGVLQNLPTLEQVPTTPPPMFGQNIPQDLPTLEETPPTPLPSPPPAGPSAFQRGGEVLEQPEVEEQGQEPPSEEPEEQGQEGQPSGDEGSEGNTNN
jgi:hypothetical protein